MGVWFAPEVVAGIAKSAQIAHPSAEAAVWQTFLNSNCTRCHSERVKAGGLVLENVAFAPIGPNAALWEKVVSKLTTDEMPPPTVDHRPDAQQSAAFVAWLITALDKYAALNPDPGRPVIRRLTRFEYSNAVRDVFGIDVNAGADLPSETIVRSFDNNGDALSVSPLLFEKYISAARRVSRIAVRDETIPRATTEYMASDLQDAWDDGAPFGGRRALAAKSDFAVGGEYELRLYFAADVVNFGILPSTEGKRMFRVRATIPAGVHSIVVAAPVQNAVAEGASYNVRGPGGLVGGPVDPLFSATPQFVYDVFIDGRRLSSISVPPPSAEELLTPVVIPPGPPIVRSLEVEGPFGKPAASAASQDISSCRSAATADDDACAETIISTITRRAFRRDVTTRDISPFMAIYRKARLASTFKESVRQALAAVLVSPAFLFRVEAEAPSAKSASGQAQALNDFELASRLSFLIWSSVPDDRLLDLASAGKLRSRKVLAEETRRLLADPKASALASNFGMQYLGLQNLANTMPDKRAYLSFSQATRNDFVEESRLFLGEVFLKNRSVIDIIQGNYSYLNERLAGHYGVPGVRGGQFRRVEFKPGDVRGGVLGQGSIALMTSHPNITSPVLRGKWVLANLLSAPPSNPPPGIPAIKASDPSGKPLTGRQQMEQHRSLPVCASCHSRMDPFGFAMENLNVVGAWRTKDEGGAIDPAVSMVNGYKFSGVPGLKQWFSGHTEEYAQAFTVSLFTFALGRRVEAHDMPEIREVVKDAARGGYKFQDLLMSVVLSPQFQMRRIG